MRRPDQKGARLAVQPRLTAFLQPKSTVQNSEGPVPSVTVRQNGLTADERVEEREEKVLLLREGAQLLGAQASSTRNSKADSLANLNVMKSEVGIVGEPHSWGVAYSSQKRSSLEAFVKRQRTTPVDLGRGENREVPKAVVGRTLQGSAYAQCPICTVQVPLTRMNHHLDIECVQQAADGLRESNLKVAGNSRDALKASCESGHGRIQQHAGGCERESVVEAGKGLSDSAVALDSTRSMPSEQPCQDNQTTDDREEALLSEASDREASGASSRDFEVMPTLNEWLPTENISAEALDSTTVLVEEGFDSGRKRKANEATQPQVAAKHNLIEGKGEPVHTAGPAQEGRLKTLLGMIREKGQRPLFGLSWAALQMRQPSAPKGHYLVENFLSEEEEAHIIASLDADVSNLWVTSRVFGDLNQGKAYGFVTDLRRRTISKPKRPMPPFLQSVLERIRTVAPPLCAFVPNECNAINYRKGEGHWLRAHVDDRQLSGTIIAGISLQSDCVMTYEKERGRPERFRVRLPRRCLQVQTSDSRYNYTHSIKNADLLGERRVSITFRQVAEPQPC